MSNQKEFNDVAILMEKMAMNEQSFVFKPIHVLEGKYIREEDLFVDKYGNVFTSIKKSHIGLQEVNEYFAFPSRIDDLKKVYKTRNCEEPIGAFFDRICEYAYLGTVNDENGELALVNVLFESLLDVERNKLNEQSAEMKDAVGKDIMFALKEEAIQDLLEMQDLSDIKSNLNEMLEAIKATKEEIKKHETPDKEARTEEKTIVDKKENKKLPFDINDMYNYVISKVIGQDDAVKKIILSFAFNYLASNSQGFDEIQPTRCLITGPTGVGKTMILETIIEYLDKNNQIKIPMVKVPTSQLTVAGYVGMNLEDILNELVLKSPDCSDALSKVEYAERNGLVFFDEIDKKGSASNGDVAGRGVLNSLLQFFDGSNYEVSVNRNKFYFNTKYLNIFASGAFTNVKDTKSKICGFNNSELSTCGESLDIKDYIREGQIPNELMGRFHQIVELDQLNIKALQSILKSSLSSPLLVEARKLQLLGVELKWSEGFIEAVAREAYKLNLGARPLKTIIEKALFDFKWETLTKQGVTSIEVNEQHIYSKK